MADSESAGDRPRVVSTIEELIELVELVDVRILRVAGEVLDGDADAEPDSGDDADSDTAPPLQVFSRGDDEFIEVRCVMELLNSEARLLADVATHYHFDEPLEFSLEIRRDFVARVGVMAAYPFLREAVHQTASRLRVKAPVLGLLKPWQIDLPESADTTDPLDVPTF